MNARTHVVIPAELVSQIDDLVGKRARSRFLTQAALKELMRLRQVEAIKRATGSWGAEDHPELKGGTSAYVRRLRKESEARLIKPLGSV